MRYHLLSSKHQTFNLRQLVWMPECKALENSKLEIVED